MVSARVLAGALWLSDMACQRLSTANDLARRLTGGKQVLLADEFIERLGPHTYGKGRVGVIGSAQAATRRTEPKLGDAKNLKKPIGTHESTLTIATVT